MWDKKKYKSYYDILNLPKDCSAEDIQNSYIKLAKLCHPDKNIGKGYSHEEFVNVKEAYSILKDPTKRKQYDYYLSNKYYKKFEKYDNYYKTYGYRMDYSSSFWSSSSNRKLNNSLIFRLILMPNALLISSFLIFALLIGGQHMFLLQNNEKRKMTFRDNSFMISLMYEDAKKQGQLLGRDEQIKRMREGTLKSADPQELLDEYIKKSSQKPKHN